MQDTPDPKGFTSVCCAICGRAAPHYVLHADGTDRCPACADAPGLLVRLTPLADALVTLPAGTEWDALSGRHVFPGDVAAATASLPGPATTLLLDRAIWDLSLDANGNIAIATGPYAIAQDVASAVRRGELRHNTTKGVTAPPPAHDWVVVSAALDLSATELLRHAELRERVRAEALARFRGGQWIGWGHWRSDPRMTRIPAGFWWRDVELCPVKGDALVPDTALWQGGGGFDRIAVAVPGPAVGSLLPPVTAVPGDKVLRAVTKREYAEWAKGWCQEHGKPPSYRDATAWATSMGRSTESARAFHREAHYRAAGRPRK
jgi:hypothetical protein